ncbi:MAG: glycosyltransferase [Verrucomicrobia bacterium]|nr:glycosyltransferase [Verrucomicrobiota bacterium]
MVTMRTVFLGVASTFAASGRRDVAYAHLDGLGSLPRILRAVRRDPNTILLFNSVNALRQSPALWLLVLNAWFYKRKQVVYWHETAWLLREACGLEAPSAFRRGWRKAIFAVFRHLLVNVRTRHLTTAIQNKQLVMFLLGVDPDVIYIAGNALEAERYPVRDRRKTTEAIRLCMAGSPCRRKGFDLFLGMARTFAQWKNRPVQYTWFGGTPEELAHVRGPAYGAVVDHSGILLPGHLEDLGAALATQDIFIQTSRDEPFGLAALEALACDLPVFCFDSTAMAEILDPDFVCTDLNDMIDKIGVYLDNRERYEPGCFRRIALGFNKDRFLKAWRAMERDFGFTQGLPEGEKVRVTGRVEQSKGE